MPAQIFKSGRCGYHCWWIVESFCQVTKNEKKKKTEEQSVCGGNRSIKYQCVGFGYELITHGESAFCQSVSYTHDSGKSGPRIDCWGWPGGSY